MNQAVSEIPIAATATDGGSLSGAVEKTDDRVVTMSGVLRMFRLFSGSHITMQRIIVQMGWTILLRLRTSVQNLKNEKDPKVLF